MTHEFTEDELKILTQLLIDDHDRGEDGLLTDNAFLDLFSVVSSLEPSSARASLAKIVDIIKNYDGQMGVLGQIQDIAEAGLVGFDPDEI